MEYHSDRFNDHSLIIFDDASNIISVLPANISGEVMTSHAGLTFGGMLLTHRSSINTTLQMFELIKSYLIKVGIEKLIYKPIPYIYHSIPAEEDRYFLYLNNAKLIARNVTSTIYLQEEILYKKGRKWSIKRAKRENLRVLASEEYVKFWNLLSTTIETKYGVAPVHNIEEILRLVTLFPDNIKLFVAQRGSEILAGALIFENNGIVHTQYLANGEDGRKIGALDLVIDHMLTVEYKHKKYFDFGISNENSGLYLNSGLISQKEGFGARSVAQDIYEVDIQ